MPRDLAEFLPAPDERLAIAGRSGTGKTTLIRQLLRIDPDRLIVIVDTKPEWDIRRWFDMRRTMRERPILIPHLRIKFLQPGVYVYRPEAPEYSDPRNDALFRGLLKRGHCTVVIDELNDFSNGGYVLPSLSKLIRQGRKPKVRIILGMQRPAQIPVQALTEASKIACFQLIRIEDRQRMAKDFHRGMLERPPGKHDFWWWDGERDDRELVLIRQTKTDGKARTQHDSI